MSPIICWEKIWEFIPIVCHVYNFRDGQLASIKENYWIICYALLYIVCVDELMSGVLINTSATLHRVEFKQALFVYKVLLQTAPPYLIDMCQARVNKFHATPSPLGCSRGSCGAAMQNNKIWKAKFSCVCSANLELTTDDRLRRFSGRLLNCFAELTELT